MLDLIVLLFQLLTRYVFAVADLVVAAAQGR